MAGGVTAWPETTSAWQRLKSAVAWALVNEACRLDPSIPAELTNMVLKHLAAHGKVAHD